MEGVFQVKTGHRMYPKTFIENSLKGMPGEVHIVLEGVNGHTGERLIAIGYRYSSKTTCCLGNLGVRYMDHPYVISWYFADSNSVD